MKNILLNSSIILALCVLLATTISCKKEMPLCDALGKTDTVTIIKDSFIYPISQRTYIRFFDSVTATAVSTTKVVRVDGLQATDEDAYSDCPTFKYAGYFRINKKFGNRLVINLSKADSITTLKSDNKDILFDSLCFIDKYTFSVLIKAKHDTIRDPVVKFSFQTKSLNLITTSVDILGEINSKCYGTCFWATRYFRILDNTIDKPVSKAIEMDSTYKPQRGDIIYFDGGHLGTVYKTPVVITTTKLGKTTYQYDFNLLEMNAKCTSALSTKVEHLLSSDILGTFFSYNTDRGEPLYYYRNL